MDLREHGGHAPWRRRPRRQEAHVGASLLEGAIRDEAVQMHVEAEVAAEALHRREHPGVQRLHRCEAVARLHLPAHVVEQRPRERLGDPRQERPVVAQPHRAPPLSA